MESQPRTLELWQEIEPCDAQYQDRAEPAHSYALQPHLGEVGDGVGAGAPQGRCHEYQQDEVADGVADGQPKHVCAQGVDQPGDPEK